MEKLATVLSFTKRPKGTQRQHSHSPRRLETTVATMRAILLALSCYTVTDAFVPLQKSPRIASRRYNFFKNLFDDAFANDEGLSTTDIRQGMLEGPNDDERPPVSTLTSTQQRWREQQQQASVSSLEGQVAMVDLYLTGVPDKDPSNDLFGSRVNISSRDRKVGQTLPASPTVKGLVVEFLRDNRCRAQSSSSPFVNNNVQGDYRLSEDGRQVRFRLAVTGYTRRIETKGSIQSMYAEEDKAESTSTTYSIPEGWLYGEADLTMVRGTVQWNNGILKIEKSAGLLGAGTKMVACGAFLAKTEA